MALDMQKLDAFMGRFVGDLGATLHAGMVVLGERLGLYKALAEGPQTSVQLAENTGTDERYLREWLASQAAGGYVEYDSATACFSLSDEQICLLATDGGPAYIPGAFELATSALRAVPRMVDAFRTGAGFGWHEHDPGLFHGTEKFFRPGYAANIVDRWIPALDAVAGKLERGGKVADIGCGHGTSTILLAQAFPRSTFHGFDYHQQSIDWARKSAERAGVADRVRFEIASAREFPGSGYDFIAAFDCLHDLGDPYGAARHVHDALASDGNWMIVEPFANDRLEDNLNPVGRIYYSASTLICTPASRSQEGAMCLGGQAGETRIREVITRAGFSRFRRAAETPFNLVFEARP